MNIEHAKQVLQKNGFILECDCAKESKAQRAMRVAETENGRRFAGRRIENKKKKAAKHKKDYRDMDESYSDVRKCTNQLLELLEEGVLDWETVCRECLSEMSESAVADMCNTCDWITGEF